MSAAHNTPAAPVAGATSMRTTTAPLSIPMPFSTRQVLGQDRPGVRGIFISSANGSLSLKGLSGQLGNPNDQALLRAARGWADCSFVGENTAVAETYGVPDDGHVIVVATRSLEPKAIAYLTRTFAKHPNQLRFMVTPQPPVKKPRGGHLAAAIERANRIAILRAQGFSVQEVASIPAGIELLQKQGFRRILCEGGPQIYAAASPLIDTWYHTVAPVFAPLEATFNPAAAVPLHLEFSCTDSSGYMFSRYRADHQR